MVESEEKGVLSLSFSKVQRKLVAVYSNSPSLKESREWEDYASTEKKGSNLRGKGSGFESVNSNRRSKS